MSFTTLLNIIKNTIEVITKFSKAYGKKSLAVLSICAILTIGICGLSSKLTFDHVDQSLVEYRDTIKQDMVTALTHYESTKDSVRRSQEMLVIERQAQIKGVLRNERKNIGCDYILVCQFHNNVESIAGCQFIKFDATYNIHNSNLSAIDIDDFQNTSISKYDIIPAIWNDRTTLYQVSEIAEIDDLLYAQLRKYAPSVDKIVFEHITIENNRDGIIMYMFNKSQEVDFTKINNCTSQFGDLIK